MDYERGRSVRQWDAKGKEVQVERKERWQSMEQEQDGSENLDTVEKEE